MTNCRKLRTSVPGQVQLPQHTESYSGSRYFQQELAWLPSSSSAPVVSHLNSLRRGFTRKRYCLLPFQELLQQFVLSMGGMST